MSFLAVLLLLMVSWPPSQAPLPVLGAFEAGWEASWGRQQLGGGETLYRVVSEGDNRVLRADSEASATALFRLLEPPAGAARIAWRWKVQQSLASGSDEARRAGDDYAARLFVIFGAGALDRDARALCYVWASDKAAGSSYRSPYVDGVHTVVLQSGDVRAGRWVAEQRDFMADYRRAFGEVPPPVGAVALMVDTDDTGGRARAWYDDIVIR